LLAKSARLDLPQEFYDLLGNLANMAQRLESAQRIRDQLLAELESRVKARTQELESALLIAQAADRAKSVFLATVSHEFRTPLTSIFMSISLLKKGDTCSSDRAIRALATLEKSSQVLMNVISDVIEYSELEAGNIAIASSPFRPAALMAEVGALVDPGAARAQLAVRVTAGHAPDLAWQGDRQHLRQVLLKLAGNAVKFTVAGQVEISSRLEEPTPGSRRLYFAVKDSGPGIPADRMEAIFRPFVQLETNRVLSQAGTGLGLSISRRLVELMGGAISVTSTVGVGSCFEFWIPEERRAEQLAPAKGAAAQSVGSPSSKA
jgi:signal transduction histidine kinase